MITPELQNRVHLDSRLAIISARREYDSSCCSSLRRLQETPELKFGLSRELFHFQLCRFILLLLKKQLASHLGLKIAHSTGAKSLRRPPNEISSLELLALPRCQESTAAWACTWDSAPACGSASDSALRPHVLPSRPKPSPDSGPPWRRLQFVCDRFRENPVNQSIPQERGLHNIAWLPQLRPVRKSKKAHSSKEACR